MKAAIIIPARYASTRLPGKPLLAETGRPLIQHVYERALEAKNADQVIVATDDKRIFNAVRAFGGDAVMTGAAHTSGSARVAQAANAIDADVIVNLQGDEPEIDAAYIDLLIDIQERVKPFASTLACPFSDDASAGPGSPEDPAAVKAILGEEIESGVFEARYFTRNICPWPRNADSSVVSPADYFFHVGVYAFSKKSLGEFAKTPAGALETAERLEQLRILEMGKPIAVGIVDRAAPGVDTPEDYRRFVERMRKGAA